MPHKNDVPYLLHIRDAVNDIKKFIDGMDFLSFSQNDLVASAVIRKLEIINVKRSRCRRINSKIICKNK
ncbi:MAG TPA: hypothetical protein ENN58_01875 [bacterium]|nr:hypothetical protein [bacterium]